MRRWVDAEASHIPLIVPHDLMHVSQEDVAEFLAHVSETLLHNYAVTWLEDERPIAMLGSTPVSPGIATIWSLLSEEALKRGPSLTRAALRFIDALVDTSKLRRVQAMVRFDHKAACDWMRMMDFEREGLMQKAAPDGTDMWLYARYF